MVPFYLSVSDLVRIPEFIKNGGDPKALDKILWDNGLDVNSGYEKPRYCTHRNLLGEIVTCERYEGVERLDDEWIATGAASFDAQVYARGDDSLVEELRSLDPRAARNRDWGEDAIGDSSISHLEGEEYEIPTTE